MKAEVNSTVTNVSKSHKMRNPTRIKAPNFKNTTKTAEDRNKIN